VALPAYPVLIRGRFDPYRWAQEPGRRSDLFLASGHRPYSFAQSVGGFGNTAVGQQTLR
jgi:rifampicin phosphotransferase